MSAACVQGVAMALLVLATWLLMWFSDVCGGGLLTAHYTHFRLRLRSQLGLLLQRRRTWLVVSAIVALDSFCISLNTSYVYQMPDVRPAMSPPVSYFVECWLGLLARAVRLGQLPSRPSICLLLAAELPRWQPHGRAYAECLAMVHLVARCQRQAQTVIHITAHLFAHPALTL